MHVADDSLKRALDGGSFVLAPGVFDMMSLLLADKHGFQALANEWWHYDYQGWEQYPLLDKSFSEL